MTYIFYFLDIKIYEDKKAIVDCNKCLVLEPNNIKALLRKAQALLNDDQPRDAYKTYQQIILIEPNNSKIKNSIKVLEKQIKYLPPKNAIRMNIKEIHNEIDFSELIIPNIINNRKMPAGSLKMLK